MPDPRVVYQDRINRVIDYVHAHLDRPLALDDLARVAFFSSYHFHRIFTAVTGETVHFFTNRLRLEKAARLLKYSTSSATDIALDCGFSSSATFSRSFKHYFGISPREYKKTGILEKSKIRKELFPIHEYILPMSAEESRRAFPVEVREFPPRRVAFIRVTAAYEGTRVPDAYARLVQWSRQAGLFDSQTFFGMSLDDPMVTPREQYRYEACLTLPDEFHGPGEESGIAVMELPACTYAVTRVSGDLKLIATATNFLWEQWLIASPYEPEHQPGLEIFLDNDRIHDWSHFDMDLCVPVKPLQNY